MSAKRIATNELNADNWDHVDEPEEMGSFRVASNDELQKRVVRTAKRRGSNIASSDEPKRSVFSNFGGFGKTPSSSASPFSFLSNATNGKSELNKPAELKFPIIPKEVIKVPEVQKIEDKSGANVNHSDEYCANLKSLNQGVCEWIKSHIEKNPYCILTPIFDDYKKYLKDFDKYKTDSTKVNQSVNLNKNEKVEPTSEKIGIKSDAPSVPLQFLGGNNTSPDTPKGGEKLDISKFNSPNNMFSKGFSSTPLAVTKPPMFSFGQQASTTTTTATSNFSFGAGKPFSFGNLAQEENKSENKPIDEEEEDEKPPEVTFTPVVEEDSVYNLRCKLFVKNAGNFGDRGVGNLYLKPISGSEKYQLILRADTNLGNLLLNMVLSAAIPIKRMGKNNVMLVTIPTPDAKPPPVPILLRVKTSEEADQLLATLEKYQK